MSTSPEPSFPPMPKSQAEWEIHILFYQLVVQQRDAAWREIERLKKVILR